VILSTLVFIASAAGFAADLEDPLAWRHHVRVPPHQCHVRLVAEVEDLDSLGGQLQDCRKAAVPPRAVQWSCLVPAGSLSERVESLSAAGNVISYEKHCVKGITLKGYQERIGRLTKELKALRMSTDSAVAGLVTAELETLRDSHERFKVAIATATLLFTAVAPGLKYTEVAFDLESAWQQMPLSATSGKVITEADAKIDGLGKFTPWRRTEYPWCEQVTTVHADDQSYGKQSEELREWLNSIGEPAPGSDASECPPHNVMRRFVKSSPESLLNRLKRFPWLKNPGVKKPVRPANEIYDDVRSRRLTKELDDLSSAPVISALVQAELTRIEKSAATLKDARGAVLLEIYTHGAPRMGF
jgi:hypothetical protein